MESIKAPYDKIDFDTLMETSISFATLVDTKLYGPVFTRLSRIYALRFFANRIDEKPPEGSDEWNWTRVKEYFAKNKDSYPYGFNALMYGMAKTEALLQGSTGVANRLSINMMAKNMAKQQGDKQIEFWDLVSAFKQTADMFVALRIMPPKASYMVENGKVRFTVDNCSYKDTCEAFRKEKIIKYDLTAVCCISRILCTYIELKLSPDYDYSVKEFANPHCKIDFLKKEPKPFK